MTRWTIPTFFSMLFLVCLSRDIHYSSLRFQKPSTNRILSEEGKKKACQDTDYDSLGGALDGRKSVESLYNMMKSQRGGNKLIEALDKYQTSKNKGNENNNQIWIDYLKSFLGIIIVFGILIVLGFISWIMYCCCICCDCCPPCKSCKRDYEERPLSK